MRMFLSAIVLVAAAAVSSAAGAQTYLSQNAGVVKIGDLDAVALYAGIGHQWASWLSVEARAGTSVGFTDGSGPSRATARIDYALSGMARIHVPLGSVSPYLLVGGTAAKISSKVGGQKGHEQDFAPTYGGGVRYAWGSVSAFAEWTRLLDADDYEVDAITIGIAYSL